MNQQQKYILNLQRKSRERKREQAFVIEGRKMFEEAPADRIKMIVASESFCKSKEGAALLKGKKFDVVSDSIFETLSDTKTPQGILAVVKQQPYSFEELLGKEKASFLLILDHLQDPGNLGTIMRAAEAAGVTGIKDNKKHYGGSLPRAICRIRKFCRRYRALKKGRCKHIRRSPRRNNQLRRSRL